MAAALILVLAAAGVTAGCGGDDGGGEAGKAATLNVGVLPIADVAPLYLGRQKGFFKKEKLTIKPRLAEGGAAVVASVVSGDNQIGFAATVPTITAKSKGLPLKIISQGVQAAKTEEKGWSGVLVSKDSSVRSVKDLEGKTIATNALNNVGDVTIRAAAEKQGADPSKLKFTEVPFPDMLASLEAGHVDAAWEVEPFLTQGKATGARSVLEPYVETAPELTVATYISSEQYIQENRDVVDRFVRAMNRSLEYASSHPDEARKIVLTYTKIPAEAAKGMQLPTWGSDLNEPTIELMADLTLKFGIIEKKPALDELIQR